MKEYLEIKVSVKKTLKENLKTVFQGPTDNVSGKRFFIPWTFFLGHFIPRNS